MSTIVKSFFVVSSITIAYETANAQSIYWTEGFSERVQHATLPNPGIDTIYSEIQSFPWGIAIDFSADKLYWGSVTSIQRSNLDGSGLETFNLGSVLREIDIDSLGSKMYWTDQGNGFIRRANLDGTAMQNLAHTGAPTGLAVDASRDSLYWIDAALRSIYRSRLDGSETQCLIGAQINCINQTSLQNPTSLELYQSGDSLFWTDFGSRDIFRANIDGTGVQAVLSGLGGPLGLDIVGNTMYWADWAAVGSYSMKKANLDGSDTSVLLTGIDASFGVAVIPEPATISVLLLGAIMLRRPRRASPEAAH